MLEFVQVKTRARVFVDPAQVALIVEKSRIGQDAEPQRTAALLLHSGVCVQVMDLDGDAGERIAAARMK
jgi:hypothetical protein